MRGMLVLPSFLNKHVTMMLMQENQTTCCSIYIVIHSKTFSSGALQPLNCQSPQSPFRAITILPSSIRVSPTRPACSSHGSSPPSANFSVPPWEPPSGAPPRSCLTAFAERISQGLFSRGSRIRTSTGNAA